MAATAVFFGVAFPEVFNTRRRLDGCDCDADCFVTVDNIGDLRFFPRILTGVKSI